MRSDDVVSALREVPLVNTLLRRRYERRFRRDDGTGCWHGSYRGFAEAAAAAPPAAPLGYDHASTSTLYEHLRPGVSAMDYPVLYWLRRVLGASATVLISGDTWG